MEDIRTFRKGDLQNVKEVLRESFFVKGKDEVYCIMTDARIEDEEGLALGPVAVKKEFRGQGIGTRLIDACLGRAREAGFPWAAVLGGEFYHRFGFESAKTWGIFLPKGQQGNEFLQILFFDAGSQGVAQGELWYCDSFYNKKGELL